MRKDDRMKIYRLDEPPVKKYIIKTSDRTITISKSYITIGQFPDTYDGILAGKSYPVPFMNVKMWIECIMCMLLPYPILNKMLIDGKI